MDVEMKDEYDEPQEEKMASFDENIVIKQENYEFLTMPVDNKRDIQGKLNIKEEAEGYIEVNVKQEEVNLEDENQGYMEVVLKEENGPYEYVTSTQTEMEQHVTSVSCAAPSVSSEYIYTQPAQTSDMMGITAGIQNRLLYYDPAMSSNQLFICFQCGKAFISQQFLNKHLIRHENTKVQTSNGTVNTLTETNMKSSMSVSVLQTGQQVLNNQFIRHENNFSVPREVQTSVFENVSNDQVNTLTETNIKSSCGKSNKTLASASGLQKPNRPRNEQFKCSICNIEFPHDQLEDHMLSHCQNNILCDKCAKSFGSLTTLSQVKHAHSENQSCGICAKIVSFRDSLREHWRSHLISLPPGSENLENSSNSVKEVEEQNSPENSLSEDNFESFKEDEKEYYCLICLKNILFKSCFERHMRNHDIRNHHDVKKEEAFVCVFCGIGFPNQFVADDHFLSHSGENLYSCNICSERFYTRNLLQNHFLFSHDGEGAFACAVCSKRYPKREILMEHLRYDHSHYGHSQSSFSCEHCTKTFTNEFYLKNHIRRHRLPKNEFVCTICGEKFTRKCELKAHGTKVHKIKLDFLYQTNNKKSACGKSNQTLVSVPGLQRPNRSCTEQFKCSICNIEFPHDQLEDHMLSCCQNNFTCGRCAKLLGSLTALSQMEHGHSENQSCGICTKIVSVRSCLKEHWRTHIISVPPRSESLENSSNSVKEAEEHNFLENSLSEAGPMCEDSSDSFKENEKEYYCRICLKNILFQSCFERHMMNHDAKKEKAFICGFCEKGFPNQFTADDHFLNHYGENLFFCNICSERFATRDLWQNHVLFSHDGEKAFVCAICSKRYPKRQNLLWHLTYNHKPSKFTCELCTKTYATETYLKKHILRHNRPKKEFVCTICGDKFPKKFELKTHGNKVHKIGLNFRCDLCPRAFVRRSLIIQHLKSHQGKKRFFCDVCQRDFLLENSFKMHMASHGGKNSRHCSYCGVEIVSRNKNALKFHKRSCEALNPFVCNTCSRRFSVKDALDEHKFSDSCENPFICILCSQCLTDKTKLAEHLTSHIDKKKSLKCSFCSETFTTPSGLCQHFLLHTNEQPYYCKCCNDGFPTRTALREHMVSHTEHLPFKCDICFEQFRVKPFLKRHIQTVHNSSHEPDLKKQRSSAVACDGPHVCQICKKTYSERMDLYNHMLVHTDEKPLVCILCVDKDSQSWLPRYQQTNRKTVYQAKAFASGMTLRQHFAFHVKQKLYQCDLCSRKFPVKSSLINHFKSRIHSDSVLNALSTTE